jgi:hypothetical protein
LKLIETNIEAVKLHGGNIEVYTKAIENKEQVNNLPKKWYKEKAELHFNKLFEENIAPTERFHKGETKLKYRWMKMRWGSCDKNGMVHLNLELIKAPKKCIDYVIVHELCHLVHSTAFYALLQKVYPDWRKTKDKLEKLMV